MSYKQCTRCVMDTDSGKAITFDSNDMCNYCTSANKGEMFFQAYAQRLNM